jgi:toxin ParE1/3/4
MKLRWSARAVAELHEIAAFIALDDPRAAIRWIQRLRARARTAARVPSAARRVPEYGRDDVREVFVRNYRIIYRLTGDALIVVTVLEGHRLIPDEVP